MTSLDYYASEDLLADDEHAARDRTRRFVQEEVMPEVVPLPAIATCWASTSAKVFPLAAIVVL